MLVLANSVLVNKAGKQNNVALLKILYIYNLLDLCKN